MKIPKEFKLFGQTIKVKFDNRLIQKNETLGEAHHRTNEIFLQPNVDGVKRDKSQIEEIFLHELVHFILDKMGEGKLAGNEKFVAGFAKLLHQALKTMK
jgi:predicted SprT family Zn-dependent metalloprotease